MAVTTRKKAKAARKTILVRAVCILLVVLMVLSLMVTVLPGMNW